jgi:hypothetical protein
VETSVGAFHRGNPSRFVTIVSWETQKPRIKNMPMRPTKEFSCNVKRATRKTAAKMDRTNVIVMAINQAAKNSIQDSHKIRMVNKVIVIVTK